MNSNFHKYPTKTQAIEALKKIKNINWPEYSNNLKISDFVNHIEQILFNEFEVLPYTFKYLPFSDFTFNIFRARALDTISDINLFSEHRYPLASYTKLGRCNFPKKPVFYSSNNALTALKETVRADNSNKRKYCISKWKIIPSTEKLNFQHFLHNEVSNEPAIRKLIEGELQQLKKTFNGKLTEDQLKGLLEILKFLHDSFIKDKTYSISASLSHRVLFPEHEYPADILLYPSIQTDFKGFNLAIHPNFVDNRMYIERFYIVELVNFNKKTGKFEINFSKYGLASRNYIKWKNIHPDDNLYKNILKEDFGGMMDKDFKYNFIKIKNEK